MPEIDGAAGDWDDEVVVERRTLVDGDQRQRTSAGGGAYHEAQQRRVHKSDELVSYRVASAFKSSVVVAESTQRHRYTMSSLSSPEIQKGTRRRVRLVVGQRQRQRSEEEVPRPRGEGGGREAIACYVVLIIIQSAA